VEKNNGTEKGQVGTLNSFENDLLYLSIILSFSPQNPMRSTVLTLDLNRKNH